ncbi:hypothetical protein SAMN03097699_1228 [Flavobacteriaceae bacterium MAR_2010_188]|nr:hypothetical protein SAMN03097699_1228 [Flavobacteriaceae bacterium MAR_2010_188]
MKTATLFKIIFLLCILPTMAFASGNRDWRGKYTKEKSIKKEFKINKDAWLKIINSYGDITVVTNNGTTTTIDIQIKTNGDNEDKVQKKLDDINVEFQASSSEVYAKTIFDSRNNSSSWWSWGNNNNVNMEVNYRISIPMTNSVNLNNDYGSINLDRLEGRAILNCDYGKITTKELMADNNSISFDYTNDSYFEYIKTGKINSDYSSFTVAKTKNLDIEADYTKSNVEISENIKYNCDYGSIRVENVNNISGNGDYLTTVIGKVYGNLEIVQDYGSIRVEELTESAGNVSINSDYAGIELGYNSAYNFTFDIHLDYGSLRSESDLNFSKRVEKSSDKYYVGTYGSGGGNNVKIDSDYGSVTFKKK